MLDALRDLMGDKLKNVKLDTSEGSVASGGHMFLWRIYNGVDKTSGEAVSVFIADKGEIEKKCGSKKAAAELLVWFKNQCSQLCKLQHPHVLRVITPLVETSKQIYLVTEQVFGSLANCFLKNFDGVGKVTQAMKDFDLALVEKQFGLYQLADALQFLHSYAGISHLNITPESIYISKKGDWKISDFIFCCPVTSLNAKNMQWNQNFRALADLTDTRINPTLGPSLNYAAPEYVLRNDPGLGSDCFSFGCVMYDVLRKLGSQPFISAGNNISTYQLEVDGMHHRKDWGGVDLPAQQTIISLTHQDVAQRLDFVKLVTTSPLFGDPLIRCLIYVSRMSAQDAKTKMPFLKTLYDSVAQYSPRILTMKIIPSLIPELEDERMFRFILPILFLCVGRIELRDVETLIIPAVGPILLRQDMPVIAQLALERFPDIITKTSFSTVEKYILPFLVNTLKHSDARIIIPLMGHIVTYTSSQLIPPQEMKFKLLPQILNLISEPATCGESKICLLQSVQKLFPVLDGATVREKIEPTLNAAITRERDSGVLMIIVDVYSTMAERYGREMTVQCIIPSLCPLLLSTSLVYDQIRSVSTLLCKLIGNIDAERKSQFEADQRAKDSVKAPKPDEPPATFDNFNAHAWKSPSIEAPKLVRPQEAVVQPSPILFGNTATPSAPVLPAGKGWADFSKEAPVKPQNPVPTMAQIAPTSTDAFDFDDFFGAKK